MTSSQDLGWWIESTDEEVYGPVTKVALQRFLADGVISPNTAVRNSTGCDFLPAADQGLAEGVKLASTRRTGDKLSEVWPRKKKDRLSLAESDIECAYHRRAAVATCSRCLAPYCAKCLMKSRKKQFYFCKRCQSRHYNRRFLAFLFDSFCISIVGTFGSLYFFGFVLGLGAESGFVALIQLAWVLFFMMRDAIFNGAGPGKRLMGLRVVKHSDGVSSLSYAQAFLRWLPHIIPFFGLVDASVFYGDPFLRRYGDNWAGTRVIDTDKVIHKVRDKVQDRLTNKGIDFTCDSTLTPQQFAQLG